MSKRLKCLEHFRVTAAIPISFFQHPIRSFPLPFHQIQVRMKKILMINRILLVLDDIWNENFIDWDLLLGPLKVGASGSKILVTTRNPLLHLSDEDCPIGQIVGPSQIGQENESLPNLSNGEVQLITNFVESLSIGMPEDGSTNWNSPPRFDVTPDESDDADDDADEMVQDNVADLPLIGLENESLYNLSNSEVQLIHEFIESLSNWMPEDGSTNWNLPPRFDVTPDESDDADDDADEMVQDNVADLPLEAHVVPDDVADAPQEAHVVPDDVANVPQEAHEVGDHAANSQRLCPICDNAIGVAFCCGHQFCVECGYRCSTCPICRDRVHIRLRLY